MRSPPLLSAILLVVVATSAGAEPALRYSWEQCDPVVQNQNFLGPSVYTQTLSVSGLEGHVSSLVILIELGIPSEAWRFGSEGCQGSSRFSYLPAVAGCAEISNVFVQALFEQNLTNPRNFIFVSAALDTPFTANPAVRYGIATLRFDHAQSGTTCGGETDPVCFHVHSASYQVVPTSPSLPLALEHGFVTWQDPSNSIGCPGATPTNSRTWGEVKALYR